MKAPHAVRWLERTAEEFEATGQRKHDVMKPAWRTPHFAPIGRWLSAHAQRLTIAIAMTTGDCRERASRLAWRRNRMAATKAWEEMIVPISRARRGLRGVKLVISDAHAGLKAAIRRASSASWQRCRVYWIRNVLCYAPKTPAEHGGCRVNVRRPNRDGPMSAPSASTGSRTWTAPEGWTKSAVLATKVRRKLKAFTRGTQGPTLGPRGRSARQCGHAGQGRGLTDGRVGSDRRS